MCSGTGRAHYSAGHICQVIHLDLYKSQQIIEPSELPSLLSKDSWVVISCRPYVSGGGIVLLATNFSSQSTSHTRYIFY